MIQLQNLNKTYRKAGGHVAALDNVELRVNEGEFIVLHGHSGCGKTTMLLTVGGMLRPSEGTVQVAGQDLYALSTKERARFRAENIGFVFQMFHLVPYLSVLKNVLLARGNANHKATEADAKALLERIGLGDRIHHLPSELSAGEKQRTAIARAMLNQPKLILADEPTGNLDPYNAKAVIGFLSEYHKQGGTVMVVTHGDAADTFADRVVKLEQGKILAN